MAEVLVSGASGFIGTALVPKLFRPQLTPLGRGLALTFPR
jgi:nucleoside-diphosphate-sugar epimerase